jgi:hypothetical protein
MRETIKRILKESTSSRCVDVVVNKPHTKPCSVFNGQLQGLCEKFVGLKWQLSDNSGLGMQKIIDDELEQYKSNTPEDLKVKFIGGLKLLYKTGKFKRDYIIKMKTAIDEGRMIYVDGEWDYINKLNTNYRDLGELLTCYLYDIKRDELRTIIDMFGKQNPRQVVTYIKSLMSGFKDYFSLEDLMSFTRNTIDNSRVGEEAEEVINNFLKSKDITIDYEGGNGDFLDMKFGVDTIADGKLVQTKNSIKGVTRIKSHIDWVAVANKFQGVGVYERDGSVVVHNGTKLCSGQLCDKNVPS